MEKGFHNESISFWHKVRKYGFDVTSLQPVKKHEVEVKQEL
ncbi:unnamed protein product [Strongylus vulgaris]|uniref:Uncharacterized protein n=1 Tax=Strongylus vulgaris TaxID=40348 RepID=A0A3P7LNP8_STRVU|nr:unnamed protein product [Strongylus vulgaris]